MWELIIDKRDISINAEKYLVKYLIADNWEAIRKTFFFFKENQISTCRTK